MTVSNQTQFVNYVGNGAALQTFAFAFRCLLSSYLTVEFRRASGTVLLALNVDYTVFLNADQEANPGGLITLTDAAQAAPTATTTVSLVSAAPYIQQLDLPTGGAFSAAAVELQLDNLTQQVQQLRDALASTLRTRLGDTLPVLPLAASRANTLQGYDAAGAPLLYANVSAPLSLLTQVQGPFGTAALPGYSFTGRTSDGVYSPAAGVVGVSAAGVEVGRFSAGQFSTVLGTAATPSRSFTGNLSTGEYSPGTNLMAWTAGGVEVARISVGQFSTVLGTAVAPAHSFTGDLNTGMFSPAADTIAWSTNGTEKLRLTSDGRLFGTALHNNAGGVSGTTNQHIASGTYTPTTSGAINVTANTAFPAQWLRVGNVVTVSGALSIDPTAASTYTQLDLSLPIPSSVNGATACGTAIRNSGGSTPQVGGPVFGNTSTVTLRFFCDGDAGNNAWYYTFTYVIV